MRLDKQKILNTLTELGYDLKKREGSAETFLCSQEVGVFTVYILLSNKVRVLIETSGTGTYYVVVRENNFSFNKANETNVVNTFKRFVKACNKFNNEL